MKALTESFSEKIAGWACQPVLDADPEAREAARTSLIDTLACMVVGAQEQQSVATMDAVLFGRELAVFSRLAAARNCRFWGRRC